MFLIRRIEVKGSVYLRIEDVVEFIKEIAATEPTDTRNRLEEAAANLCNPSFIHPVQSPSDK